MATDKMIMIGEKESFIIRVLIGKAQEAGIFCEYVKSEVNDISKKLEGSPLVALYMDEDTMPGEQITHFLIDKLQERDLQMIMIGEQRDLIKISEHIPQDLVYTNIPRPVDNAEFIKTVKEYFKKASSGDLKKSILVVDDDPNYLGIVREWLKETYKVYMANSGMQAIKWLSNNKVDLILLDHEMPVTSGPQVLEMLRSDEDTRDIPVMFLTGKSDKDSVMKVVSLKPEGYFLKTIQKDELIEKLKEFFILHK